MQLPAAAAAAEAGFDQAVHYLSTRDKRDKNDVDNSLIIIRARLSTRLFAAVVNSAHFTDRPQGSPTGINVTRLAHQRTPVRTSLGPYWFSRVIHPVGTIRSGRVRILRPRSYEGQQRLLTSSSSAQTSSAEETSTSRDRN